MNHEENQRPRDRNEAGETSERPRRRVNRGVRTLVAGAIVAQAMLGLSSADTQAAEAQEERAHDSVEQLNPRDFDLPISASSTELAAGVVAIREAQLVGNLTPGFRAIYDDLLFDGTGTGEQAAQFSLDQATANAKRFADAQFVAGWESNGSLTALVEQAVAQNEEVASMYFGEPELGYDLVLEDSNVIDRDADHVTLELVTRVEYSGNLAQRLGYEPAAHRRLVTLVPETGTPFTRAERYLIADWVEIPDGK